MEAKLVTLLKTLDFDALAGLTALIGDPIPADTFLSALTTAQADLTTDAKTAFQTNDNPALTTALTQIGWLRTLDLL